MTITSAGFNGSIDEAQFAILMSLAGIRYSVAGPTDYQVSPVPGNRQVSAGPGVAYGCGVTASSSAAVNVSFATPSAGAWHLVVLRRDWQANTSTVMSIAGATTTTVTPTSPPASYPETLQQTAGLLDDQPLAWVWVNAATTAITVFDVRSYTTAERLKALSALVASLQGSVATLANLPATVGGLEDAIAELPDQLTIDASKITNQQAIVAGNSLKVGGRTIFVQSAAPTGAADGDLWFW